MGLKQLKKELEEDNKSDLKQLRITKEDYQKLKGDWFHKETEDFELVCQIELRNQILKKLNNFQKS